MPIYVGLDSSTQGLTLVAIEVAGAVRRIVFSHTLNFDAGWPHFGTRHGVLPSDDPLVALAPPLLWVEALEQMMRLAAREIDLSAVRAIAGSAQQHGSVYLGIGAEDALARVDARASLAEQVAPLLSRRSRPSGAMRAPPTSAMRSPTRSVGTLPWQPDRIEDVRTLHGSADPQFAKADPAAYASTERIHLVSSFLCSMLVGRHAPLDPGDASGMNLMDIATAQWSPDALDATAPQLASACLDRALAHRRGSPVAGLAGALRLAARACRRLVGRQPLQPDWHGPGARRSRRCVARDQRHRVRPHARGDRRRDGHRSRVRCPDGRVHGAHLLPERFARPRARS